MTPSVLAGAGSKRVLCAQFVATNVNGVLDFVVATVSYLKKFASVVVHSG